MRNFAKPSVFIYDYEFGNTNSFLAKMTLVYIYVVNPNIFSNLVLLKD